MRHPVVDEALRRIQDIVAEETGAALAGPARARVGQVMQLAFGQLAGTGHRETHLARDLTILLADLRGFTALSASQPAATVLEVLNGCFVAMTEVIFRHRGVVDKFMGDSILALFEGGGDAGAADAVACAVEMQCAMEGLNAGHVARGLPELYLGIGINTGRVTSAMLGSHLHSERAVIGDEVNLASRIESLSLRGQVLVSQATHDRCAGLAQAGEPMDVFVKGRGQLVVVREVLGIPSRDRWVPRREMRRSPRVQVKLPFSYRAMVRDVVVPQPRRGLVLDIGYHGVLAEIDSPATAFSEVLLDLDLPLVGQRLADLCGKVVTVAPREGGSRVGIEFTAMTPEQRAAVRLFVQLLVQAAESD